MLVVENRYILLVLMGGFPGRTFIAVASKGYPSRHIYDSTDGRTEGFLGGKLALVVRTRDVNPMVPALSKFGVTRTLLFP